MRQITTGIIAGLAFLAASAGAQADIPFSGAGASGTLAAASETWTFNFDGGAAGTGFLNNWGSPGVGAGTDAYGGGVNAFGMAITFSGGGTINAASIATGNGAGCAGTTTGGTTFCNVSPTNIWEAFLVGPSSIEFLAQDPSFFLEPGDFYFVNIFFDGATPTSFVGAWLTDFQPNPSVPEPATLALLGLGLAGLSLVRRRRAN